MLIVAVATRVIELFEILTDDGQSQLLRPIGFIRMTIAVIVYVPVDYYQDHRSYSPVRKLLA